MGLYLTHDIPIYMTKFHVFCETGSVVTAACSCKSQMDNCSEAIAV